MAILQRLKQLVSKSSPPQPDLSQDIAHLRRNLNFGDLKKSILLENEHEDLKWKKKYYQLRTIWSWLTILLLALNLGFTFWLVNSVGTGRLNFIEYKTFLNIIAGEIIINILGLVAIVMHFLFPNNKSNE